MPSFSGSSYLLLRRVERVSRDVSIVMRFKPMRADGLLLYAAQYDDGRGDFLSLSLRQGYVEFRYSFYFISIIIIIIIIIIIDDQQFIIVVIIFKLHCVSIKRNPDIIDCNFKKD